MRLEGPRKGPFLVAKRGPIRYSYGMHVLQVFIDGKEVDICHPQVSNVILSALQSCGSSPIRKGSTLPRVSSSRLQLDDSNGAGPRTRPDSASVFELPADEDPFSTIVYPGPTTSSSPNTFPASSDPRSPFYVPMPGDNVLILDPPAEEDPFSNVHGRERWLTTNARGRNDPAAVTRAREQFVRDVIIDDRSGVGNFIADLSRTFARVTGRSEETVSETIAASGGMTVPEVHAMLFGGQLRGPVRKQIEEAFKDESDALMVFRDKQGLEKQAAALRFQKKLQQGEVFHDVDSFQMGNAERVRQNAAFDRVIDRAEQNLLILSLELNEEEDPFA